MLFYLVFITPLTSFLIRQLNFSIGWTLFLCFLSTGVLALLFSRVDGKITLAFLNHHLFQIYLIESLRAEYLFRMASTRRKFLFCFLAAIALLAITLCLAEIVPLRSFFYFFNCFCLLYRKIRTSILKNLFNVEVTEILQFAKSSYYLKNKSSQSGKAWLFILYKIFQNKKQSMGKDLQQIIRINTKVSKHYTNKLQIRFFCKKWRVHSF